MSDDGTRWESSVQPQRDTGCTKPLSRVNPQQLRRWDRLLRERSWVRGYGGQRVREDGVTVDELRRALDAYRQRDPDGYIEYIAGGPSAADDWPEYQSCAAGLASFDVHCFDVTDEGIAGARQSRLNVGSRQYGRIRKPGSNMTHLGFAKPISAIGPISWLGMP